MRSRRTVLSLCSLTATSAFSGCSMGGTSSKPVEVILHNDDTEPWQLTVLVEGDTGEQVFRTEERIPADDGNNLGEVRVGDAFTGRLGDQFTVTTWLDAESAGTFEYEITCSADNYISLLVEHRSHRGDGEPVHYVPHRCSR